MNKKRIIISVVISALILGITIPGMLLINFIYSSKDYKQALAVERENSKPAQSYDNTQSGSTAGPDGTTEKEPEIKDPKAELTINNYINILFLGIDRTEERDKTMGIYRSDCIALAKIDLDTKKVEVLSIPRDTYTYIPVEGKKDKINHAYAFGSLKGHGVESSIEVVEKFIKYSTVDYYFSIEMEPIPDIVDAIGGVDLDVELDMKTHGMNISKGFQHLDGRQAYAYICWRYSGLGDIDRVKRQQKLFTAMYVKLKETGQLFNAVKIVMGYKDKIKTNMTMKQLAALSVLAGDIQADAVNYRIVPGEDRTINRIWYWVPDEEKTDALLKELFLK